MADRLQPSRAVVETFVRERVQKLRVKEDGSALGLCPLHDDRNPSFSVDLNTGLWKCHGACATGGNLVQLVARLNGETHAQAEASIRGWMGESADDPFGSPAPARKTATGKAAKPAEPKKPPSEADLEAVYPYKHPDGRLEFEVLRYKGKDFRQRRPDGKGGWSYTLGDADRSLPFQLPDVEMAVVAKFPVWICEGEKDALSVTAALGGRGIGTTLAGGADAWRSLGSKAAAYFKGAIINVIPDRDEPGSKWLKSVVGHLGPVAAQMDLWASAAGKDVTDHLSAGLGLNALVRIAEADVATGDWLLPEPEMVAISAFAQPYPEVRWLVQERVAVGDISLLVGPSGARKSWLTLDLALSCALGEQPWGWGVNIVSGPVLYIDEENPVDEVHRRVHLIARARGFNLSEIDSRLIMTRPRQGLSFRSDLNQVQLLRMVKRHRPVMVVLDSATAVGDFKDDNNATEVRRFFHQSLVPLQKPCNSTILVVHHANKAAEWGTEFKDISALIRGSQDWKGASDSVLFAMGAGADETMVHAAKIRRGPSPPLLRVKMSRGENGEGVWPMVVGEGMVVESGSDDNVLKAARIVLKKLAEAEGYHLLESDLVQSLAAEGISRASMQRAVNHLLQKAQVRKGEWAAIMGDEKPYPKKSRGRQSHVILLIDLSVVGEEESE